MERLVVVAGAAGYENAFGSGRGRVGEDEGGAGHGRRERRGW